MYLQLHQLGVSFKTSKIGSREMLHLAHFYATSKILDPSAPKWPDMELMTCRQDPEYLFHDGLPKSSHEAIQKCMLA